MLLETLDIKKDDIVIYSQNIFDLENNFKIIFKDDPHKKIRKIGFDDVCHFVNKYTPKNLIVYRLMTNITDFSLHTAKFGFKIYIKEEQEIIYFDPVFAIRELEEYPGTVDENLRFRIQQIGLTTLSRFENVSNFAEIYSIDLRPYEAKYQKDKVFADAIFALDNEYNNGVRKIKKSDDKYVNPDTDFVKGNASTGKIQKDKVIKNSDQNNSLSVIFNNVRNESKGKKSEITVPDKKQKSDNPVIKVESEKERKELNPKPHESEIIEGDIKIIKHDISEDKDFDYKQIIKMTFKKSYEEPEPVKEFPKLIKHTSGNNDAFRKFLEINPGSTGDKGEVKKGGHIVDIFKSPEPLKKLVEEREKEKIILKLDKK